jgi:hypothetical protein
MITTTHNNLAKLMSVEDITVIQTSDPTASFDTKERILRMPNWNDLTDLETQSLIGHEIGHALYTNPNEWMKAIYSRTPPEIFKDYLNVVEDARIEKLVKIKYPGMKKIFFEGYKKIVQRDFMQLDPNAELALIDVLNLHFKFFGIVDVKLESIHESFIKKIEEIESFSDVVRVSQEIFDYCKEAGDLSRSQTGSIQILVDMDNTESNSGNSKENSDGSGTIKASSDKDNEKQSGWPEKDNKQEKRSRSESNDSNRNKGSDSENKQFGKEGGITGSNVPDTSKTLRSLDRSLTDRADRNTHITYCDLPKPNLDKIIFGYKQVVNDMKMYLADSIANLDEESHDTEIFEDKRSVNEKYRDFLKVNGPSINLHKQLFEMRKKASEFNKTKIFRSGTLDMNKMYSYKYDDQIFKTYEVKPNGKKHGLVFILDLSASMYSLLSGVKKKVLELIMFCRQVNIPFVCYGFSDLEYIRTTSYNDTNFKEVGKMEYTLRCNENFKLIELFHSTMTESEFKIAFNGFLRVVGHSGKYRLGGTPLNETHLCLDALVSKFRKETDAKIVNVIYFTDGAGSSLDLKRKYSQYQSNSIGYSSSNIVINDDITKKMYTIEKYIDKQSRLGFMNPIIQQRMILDIMRDRMQNVKILNFYITDNPYNISWTQEEIEEIFGKSTNINEISSKFAREVGVCTRSNYDGFDEIFLMASNLLKYKGSSIAKTNGTAALSSAFKQASKTKSKVNIMISRFIDLIT